MKCNTSCSAGGRSGNALPADVSPTESRNLQDTKDDQWLPREPTRGRLAKEPTTTEAERLARLWDTVVVHRHALCGATAASTPPVQAWLPL